MFIELVSFRAFNVSVWAVFCVRWVFRVCSSGWVQGHHDRADSPDVPDDLPRGPREEPRLRRAPLLPRRMSPDRHGIAEARLDLRFNSTL